MKEQPQTVLLASTPVRDVPKTHLPALESQEASGRYIYCERVFTDDKLVDLIRRLYPDRFVPPWYMTIS
jgi:cinnamoyl-CoA reductase